MFSLKPGYFVTGICVGLILLWQAALTLPDGKLHMVFCAVGQGDSTYIRFPDGHDMLIDGGPGSAVLRCLGEHMPFWDRAIDVVVLTHPQNDHLMGLLSVLERFHIGVVVHNGIGADSDPYRRFSELILQNDIPVRTAIAGEGLDAGTVHLSVLWPSAEQVARMQPQDPVPASDIAGAQAFDPNDGSIVVLLKYGDFEALLPGDADTRVSPQYALNVLPDAGIEVFKVPHHGSRMGIDEALADRVFPGAGGGSRAAVISVGKNTYGHPSPEVISLFGTHGVDVFRTDQVGDIEIVSDGSIWSVKTGKKR